MRHTTVNFRCVNDSQCDTQYMTKIHAKTSSSKSTSLREIVCDLPRRAKRTYNDVVLRYITNKKFKLIFTTRAKAFNAKISLFSSKNHSPEPK